MSTISINDKQQQIREGERLIDAINRSGIELSQVCYHPQLGPIQTCDTCIIEVDGKLARACGTSASSGMNVSTRSPQARAAQLEAFDRILGNHLLYCTVCDNNNGNCTSVQLTVLPEVGESPLPRINPRFGHPTPQQGVEAERKWNRSDYRQPGYQLVQIQSRYKGKCYGQTDFPEIPPRDPRQDLNPRLEQAQQEQRRCSIPMGFYRNCMIAAFLRLFVGHWVQATA
jgi:ferredoxin